MPEGELRADGAGRPDVAIGLTGVTKEFEGASGVAVDNLSLDIESGTIVALLGPSAAARPPRCR